MTESASAAYAPCGAELILVERRRQIEAEGWSIEHDREHGPQRLALAAQAYERNDSQSWPFDNGASFKRKGPLRNLIRAGALYQAAADVAPETGSAYHDRAFYEKAVARVEDKIDALIAEVREVIG